MNRFLFFIFLWLGFFYQASQVHATTFIPVGTIATTTEWNASGSPYVVDGSVFFTASSSLIVRAGTKIVLGTSGYIGVFGSISIEGTELDPVVIQSKNGTCSSETRLEIKGKYTPPAPTASLSWLAMKNGATLYVYDRNIAIDNALFDCANVGAHFERVLSGSINDSLFTKSNDSALQVVDSRLSINRVIFDGGDGVGLNVFNSEIQASSSRFENFSYGINVMASDATITDSVIKENNIGVAVRNLVFQVVNSLLPVDKKFVSKVFIQNTLYENNVDLNTWSNVPGSIVEKGNYTDEKGPLHLFDPVIIIPGILGSALDHGQWIIDPIFHVYDNLIESLEAHGYVRGETLFLFGYDWHQSNTVTASLLKKFIDNAKRACICSKVDIVAHSMGGLVARSYIQGPEYNNDVDQLLFLGTPHFGAPSAYRTWFHNSFGDEASDKLLYVIFSREAKKAGYSKLSQYLQNAPIYSVKELLPTYQYLSDTNNAPLPYSPDHYVMNSFLENINASVSDLFKSVKLFNITAEILNSKSAFVTPSGFKVTFTQGATTSAYGFPTQIKYDRGDKTVPHKSSQAMFATSTVIIKSEHKDIPTVAEGLIIRSLTGRMPIANRLVKKPFHPSFNLLLIHTLFPVKITIIDPLGRKISSSTKDITDAFYNEDDTGTYIFIPEPEVGNYELEIEMKKLKKDISLTNIAVDSALTNGNTFTTKRQTIKNLGPQQKIKIPVTVIKTATSKVIYEKPQKVYQVPLLQIPEIDNSLGTSSLATSTTNVDVEESSVSSDPLSFDSVVIPPVDTIDAQIKSNNEQNSTTTSSSTADSTQNNQINKPENTNDSKSESQQSNEVNQNISAKEPSHRRGSHRHPIETKIVTLEGIERECYNIAMEILEKLFGSAAKVKIIKLFLFNPEAYYSRDEIMTKTKSSLYDVRLNITLLEKALFIKSKVVSRDGKKTEVWFLDTTFPYLSPLQTLLINIMPLSSKDISRRLQKAGKMKLIITAGVFIQDWDSRVDLLVVGDNLRKGALENAIKGLEADIGKELTYASFETSDFLYRLGMYDKLIRDILDFPHTVVLDKIRV